MDADTDDEAEVLFRAKLQRQDANTPWGFRLQGGADFDKPLTLLKVVEGSIACKAGLQPGDIVFKLAGGPAGSMTHKDAQEAIRQSANSLEIIVGRSEEKAISIQSSGKTSEVKPVEATAQVKEPEGPAPQAPSTNNHAPVEEPVLVPKKPEPAASQTATPIVNHTATVIPNDLPQPKESLSADAPSSIKTDVLVSNSKPASNSKPVTNSEPVTVSEPVVTNSVPVVINSEPVSNEVTKTVVPDRPVEAAPSNLEEEIPPPVPPLPPTVEVTPPSDPPAVTKPKTRRQRRAVQNDIPSGDIPSKQINGSAVKASEPNNVSTVEMVIPKIIRPSTDSTNLLGGVSEEKLLTTADRRSGSNSPRNSSSPRLPSSPKLPSSPRASPLLPWQQFLIDERKITNIPVSHERSNSDNGIPLLTPDSVPLHIQHEASRVHNEASRLQHPSSDQYSMVDLYPWRRPRSSSVDNSAGVTNRTRHIPVFMAPNIRDIRISTAEREVAPPPEQMRTEPMKASLKLVGRRIENTMPGYSSDEAAYAGAFPTISEEQKTSTRTDYSTLGPEDIYFSASSPDLVDIPMPAVKEMVADLNRRLEAIAAQHPKLAEMSAPEFGITFEKRANEGGKDNSSSSSEEEMKEIFINSPPSDLDLIKAKMLGLENYAALQRLYDSQSLSPSKPDDFGSSLKPSRRVHFADPPEQSVIEIEPRHRRHRRRPLSAEPTSLDLSTPPTFPSTSYSSPLTSEPALSSPYLTSQTYGSSSISQPSLAASSISQPSYSASAISQPSFSAISQPVTGLYSQPMDASVDQFASYQPQQRLSTPTSQGGNVNISITHRQGEQLGKQYTFTMPPGQPGQPTRFHYTISGKQPTDPFALSYSIPPSYEESMRNRGINTSQFRSRDDTFLPSTHFASPVPYQRSPTPESYNLQHIRSYSPSASPTRMMSPTDRGSPQTIQSKSFKVLEATLQDQPDSGGNGPETGRPSPMRVEVLGHPREVMFLLFSPPSRRN